MKEYSSADIRNLALVGHAGAGKTMLGEAMLAAVLLTENATYTYLAQTVTTIMMVLVLFIALIFMLLASKVFPLIGMSGASIISRVMGLILSSVAVTNVLEGIKTYFQL